MVSFHQDRKYLNLKEGESITYLVVSIPKDEVNFDFKHLAESGTRFYYLYSPSLKNKMTINSIYYKQTFTRENNKINAISVSSSLEEFENLYKN